jgi:hypothetical protein
LYPWKEVVGVDLFQKMREVWEVVELVDEVPFVARLASWKVWVVVWCLIGLLSGLGRVEPLLVDLEQS